MLSGDFYIESHGVGIGAHGASIFLVLLADARGRQEEDATRWLVFDEAMEVAELIRKAITIATNNAVEEHGG